MSFRLAAAFRIQAYRMRIEREGAFATVIRRGGDESGSVLVKVNRLDGTAKVFDRWTGIDGDVTWVSVPGEGWTDEKGADAYLQQRLSRDADLWAIEVENEKGNAFLDADLP